MIHIVSNFLLQVFGQSKKKKPKETVANEILVVGMKEQLCLFFTGELLDRPCYVANQHLN